MTEVEHRPAGEALAGCRPVVLSPHYDDAVLSCGALLATCGDTATGADVVTVFTGAPELPLSAEAEEFHRRCGLDGDAVASRAEEDAHAMRLLGVTPHAVGIPEALYRRDRDGNHRYPHGDAMSRVAVETEAELVAELAARLAAEPAVRDADVLVAPLGIGNHIDHRVTREAVRLIGRDPDALLWYEDAPYVLFPPELRGPDGPPTVDPRVYRFDDGQWEAKLRAIACYVSQQAILLGGNTTDLPRFLTMYGTGVGGGAPAERYWPLAA